MPSKMIQSQFVEFDDLKAALANLPDPDLSSRSHYTVYARQEVPLSFSINPEPASCFEITCKRVAFSNGRSRWLVDSISFLV